MAEKEARFDQSIASAMSKLMPTQFPSFGPDRVEAMLEAQKEVSALVEHAGRDWLDRVKAETELASELATKLAATQSFPAAAQAYQEWMGARMKLLIEDSQKLMADGQKLMNASMRLLSNGKGS